MLCRHLLVEPIHTQATYVALKQRDWTRHGAPIQSIGDRNVIPLGDIAPSLIEISAVFEWPVDEIMHRTSIPKESLTESYARFLAEVNLPPAPFPPHDVLGDIVLMRVGSEQREALQSGNTSQFVGAAKILLETQKKIRAVFIDLGVVGPYRLRNLIPIMARNKTSLIRPEDLLPNHPSELFSTRTKVRTDGVTLTVDPGKAYYNARLDGQRRKFTERLLAFSLEVGRPLRIADPYCGVGPMLRSIIHHRVPIQSLLGVDLNPAAIELTHINMPSSLSVPIDIIEGRAKDIASMKQWQGTMDVICCNLPRAGSSALADPLPFLCSGGILIGWIHAPAHSKNSLSDALENDLNCTVVFCQETRSYSSTESVYMIEAQF